MNELKYQTPKFKEGDRVIADGEEAVILEVIPPAESDWFEGYSVSYTVEWPTEEWGTFNEDEIEGVK